jgi:secreted Zn-dependent insulinase-like peptidase
VGVDLTEEGLKNYEEIVKIIFQYIDMLKKEGVKKWIFDEVCDILSTNFHFAISYSITEPCSDTLSFELKSLIVSHPGRIVSRNSFSF